MHLNFPHILTIATLLLTSTLAAPMLPEKNTCGPEEDLACYGDGSNGKRSANPDPAPMFPEKTCGPEEDLACYSDGSNGKRSPGLPSITASKVTIPPLGAPTNGLDGGGYLRRSPPRSDIEPTGIVIGSKAKRSAERPPPPPPPEDVGAYDEEKKMMMMNRRSPALSLDAAGHPILTGDNYPAIEDKRTLVVDKWDYPAIKRSLPVDAADYPGARGRKREAIPSPDPLRKLEIDGDYPVPDDSSYPV